MHYITKKYCLLFSISLLLSQPLSAMHYFDRKLFVGCCLGALGTMGALFIKQRFFPSKPAIPKANNPNMVTMLKTACSSNGSGFFIDEQTNTAYPYNDEQVLKVTPYTPPAKPLSWQILLQTNGQFVCFDQVTGKQTYFFEGNDTSSAQQVRE